MDISHFAYPFISWWLFEFQVSSFTIMNIFKSVCEHMFVSFGQIPRSGIAEAYGKYMFSLVKYCHILFSKVAVGNSPAVQWLGLCAFAAEGMVSVSGLGSEILQAARYSQTNKKTKRLQFWFLTSNMWVPDTSDSLQTSYCQSFKLSHSKGFLIVALNYVFQMVTDKHLFMLICFSGWSICSDLLPALNLKCLYYFQLKEFFIYSGYKFFFIYMLCEIFSQTVAWFFVFLNLSFKEQKFGTSLVVQRLRLQASSSGGQGSIPGLGTGSHMLQLRASGFK